MAITLDPSSGGGFLQLPFQNRQCDGGVSLGDRTQALSAHAPGGGDGGDQAHRPAVQRAPPSEPPATTARKAPNSPAPPWNTYLAMRGSTIKKLKANVDTTVTKSSVDRNTGLDHA